VTLTPPLRTGKWLSCCRVPKDLAIIMPKPSNCGAAIEGKHQSEPTDAMCGYSLIVPERFVRFPNAALYAPNASPVTFLFDPD